MSELIERLNEATRFVEKMDKELKRLDDEAEKKGWYDDYDEYKTTANEDLALYLDAILAAKRPEGIDLVFGDDIGTFREMFKPLTGSYLARVNGVDIMVKDLSLDNKQVGIGGLVWNDIDGKPTTAYRFWELEEITSVEIY